VTSRFLSRAERALLTSWKPLGPILVSEPASELAPQGLGPCFPLSINSGTIDLLVNGRDSDGCQQIIHTEATVGVISPLDSASQIILTRRPGEVRPREARPYELRTWFDRVAVDLHDNHATSQPAALPEGPDRLGLSTGPVAAGECRLPPLAQAARRVNDGGGRMGLGMAA
jgi:hypothetical protein